MAHLLFSLVVFLSIQSVWAVVLDPQYDEYEGEQLVEKLIEDEKWDLAAQEVRSLPKKSALYSILRARIYFQNGQDEQVIEVLSGLTVQMTSSLSPSQNKFVPLLRAQSYQRLGQKRLALQSWLATDDHYLNKQDFDQKIRFLQKEGDWVALFRSLDEKEKHRDIVELTLIKYRIESLILMGLTRQAYTIGLEFLTKPEIQAPDLLNIVDLFAQSNLQQEAYELLLFGQMRFSDEISFHLNLAQLDFNKNNLFLTTESFSKAAKIDSKYHRHAADFSRQSRQLQNSALLRLQIPDAKERLRQEVAQSLERNQYTHIAAMRPLLSRSELKSDEEINYAQAYALTYWGDYELAQFYLQRLTEPHLRVKASQLQQAILLCQREGKACF